MFNQVLDRVGPLDVYEDSMQRQKSAMSIYGRSDLYPANLYFEGHDQHQRWFLTSLVASVALTG